MKNNSYLLLVVTALACFISMHTTAQWNQTLLGHWSFSPTPTFPNSVTVGVNWTGFATLHVRGDEMPINSPQFGGLCTFRTDVASAQEQGWEMWRDVNHIGRIWHFGANGHANGGHRAFHFQSTEPRDDGQDRYSGAFILNNSGNGLWVIHDGPPTGGRVFDDPALQLLDRTGYAALGRANSFINTGNPGAAPRGPWSRLHLFHNVQGSRPMFAFRSQMQNGLTMSGNSDLAYVGQWYDRGQNGTGAEVDDSTNVVIANSEDVLKLNGHNYDNISFRFMGAARCNR